MKKIFQELPIVGIRGSKGKDDEEAEEIILKGSIDINSIIMFCELNIDGKKYTELHTLTGIITIPIEYEEFKILYTNSI